MSNIYKVGDRVRVLGYDPKDPKDISNLTKTELANGRTGTVVSVDRYVYVRVDIDPKRPASEAFTRAEGFPFREREIRPSSTVAPEAPWKPFALGSKVRITWNTLGYSDVPGFVGSVGVIVEVPDQKERSYHVKLDKNWESLPWANTRGVKVRHHGLEAYVEPVPTHKFAIGDRVVSDNSVSDYCSEFLQKPIGTVTAVPSFSGHENRYTVKVESNNGLWPFYESELSLYEAPKPVNKSPSFNRVVGMSPLTRKILNHLETKGSISPIEATVAYGTIRLAHQIWLLREEGYVIDCTIREDAAGHKYGRYTLTNETAW